MTCEYCKYSHPDPMVHYEIIETYSKEKLRSEYRNAKYQLIQFKESLDKIFEEMNLKKLDKLDPKYIGLMNSYHGVGELAFHCRNYFTALCEKINRK